MSLNADFLCALAAMLCYGIADVIYKRAAMAGIKPHQFLMAQAWIFAPSIVVYALVTGTLHVVPAAGWGAAAGLCVYTALYNFSRSLRDGAVSVKAPIFRLNFTMTVALAVLILGEPLGASKVAGLALALLAVWLILGGGAPGQTTRASLVRVFVATVAMGLANFCYKLGVQHGATPATMVVFQASVFFPLATWFGYLPERRFNPPRGIWPFAGAAAVLLGIAFIFLATGLVHGQASVLVPVAQMGFVITAAAGIVLLGEQTSVRSLAGLAAAAGALAFLAAS